MRTSGAMLPHCYTAPSALSAGYPPTEAQAVVRDANASCSNHRTLFKTRHVQRSCILTRSKTAPVDERLQSHFKRLLLAN